eukprot:1149731-Pelagomonas_calceolata.AAC.7
MQQGKGMCGTWTQRLRLNQTKPDQSTASKQSNRAAGKKKVRHVELAPKIKSNQIRSKHSKQSKAHRGKRKARHVGPAPQFKLN